LSFTWRGSEKTGCLFQAHKAKLSTSRLREVKTQQSVPADGPASASLRQARGAEPERWAGTEPSRIQNQPRSEWEKRV
jgi:hypothetical protein